MAEKIAVPDSDGDSLLKKRARRRLVGAVALALLAAIVLPMVMDHEPRPAVQDIQVRIPSQDAAPERPLSGKAAKPEKPAKAEIKSEAKPEPKPEVVAEPKHDAEPKPEIKPEAKPEPGKPEAKAEAKPEPKPEVKPKPEPKPDADAKAAEAARAAKALNGETSKHDQWVLQLGAYQDQGNVKALQAKVKELGYASYTEKVTTPQGDRLRVRAGPFASKDEAEKAQARLKKIGAGGPPGGVVAPK